MDKERNILAFPPRAVESSRAGGPCQSEPEMIVLVSMTSFTRPLLGPDGLHLGLDFLDCHRFARLGADAVKDFAEFSRCFAAAQFGRQEFGHRRGFKQAIGPGLLHQRFGQIQLDRNAHTNDKMAAETVGCQTQV